MSIDSDPDIVEVIMRACEAGGLDAAAARLIEMQIRDQYGGLRVRIPKKKKHMTQEERERVCTDSRSNLSTEEITSRHKISRATLYRLIKRE